MENAFKFVFSIAVILFCFTIIGAFLLIIKILLLTTDHVQIMGLIISSAQ